MKLKKFMVYIDDGKNCFKEAVPAKDEKSAMEYLSGNGEVIAVKDITDDYPISPDCVYDALKAKGFGEIEIDLIIRTLQRTDIANDCI